MNVNGLKYRRATEGQSINEKVLTSIMNNPQLDEISMFVHSNLWTAKALKI